MVTGLQPRQVEVLTDSGAWVPGELQAMHTVDGMSKGFVRYREHTNASHLRWFDEARIRGLHAD